MINCSAKSFIGNKIDGISQKIKTDFTSNLNFISHLIPEFVKNVLMCKIL